MRETSFWPQQENKLDLTFVLFYSFIAISFLSPWIFALIAVSQDEVITYNSTSTVIEKYEKEFNKVNSVFNPATEMSQVQSRKVKRDIIVVNYANAEEGKAEVQIDMDSYNKINVGDKVNLEIEESYPKNETSFEKDKMLYYKISYIK